MYALFPFLKKNMPAETSLAPAFEPARCVPFFSDGLPRVCHTTVQPLTQVCCFLIPPPAHCARQGGAGRTFFGAHRGREWLHAIDRGICHWYQRRARRALSCLASWTFLRMEMTKIEIGHLEPEIESHDGNRLYISIPKVIISWITANRFPNHHKIPCPLWWFHQKLEK